MKKIIIAIFTLSLLNSCADISLDSNNMKEKLYCANKKIGRDVPEAEQYDKKYKCEV